MKISGIIAAFIKHTGYYILFNGLIPTTYAFSINACQKLRKSGSLIPGTYSDNNQDATTKADTQPEKVHSIIGAKKYATSKRKHPRAYSLINK